MALCLVVEDEPTAAELLGEALRAAGHSVCLAASAAAAATMVAHHMPEVVLLDLGLPDADGLEVIPRILLAHPLARIVVLTGRNSVADAVAALRAGARHYLVKPYDLQELLVVVERECTAVNLVESTTRTAGSELFWGRHPAMRHLKVQVERVARSPWTPVLIQGETGTGKEVVARELHRLTAPEGPFVALNCASMPQELLESELFGHERGAFTGADSRRRGLAEIAHRGSLFLDEIGEMPPALQAKLLRYLQDGRFRRVGGSDEIVSRCRFIAATHRDLEALQRQGLFRDDLYFRLAVIGLQIPPLRDRGGDAVALAYVLLERIAGQLGVRPRQLAPDAERAICEHVWRGNVRELANRLERALVLSEDDVVRAHDLDLPADAGAAGPSAIDEPEPVRLRRVLESCRWNVSRAARQLGLERHQLRYRMSRHGIERPDRVDAAAG